MISAVLRGRSMSVHVFGQIARHESGNLRQIATQRVLVEEDILHVQKGVHFGNVRSPSRAKGSGKTIWTELKLQ